MANKTIAIMGDSLSHDGGIFSFGYTSLWAHVLQTMLRKNGKGVTSRNFAKSGNTTTQMIARFPQMTMFDIPEIGIVFGGVNDPGNSISQATTQENIETMLQTLRDAGCKKLIVVSAQLLNYTSGGDVVANVPKTDTACYYATVIAAQKAAATTKGAVFVDLYNIMRQRIIEGADSPQSASWHVANTNQHLNQLGHQIVAGAVYDTISKNNWL